MMNKLKYTWQPNAKSLAKAIVIFGVFIVVTIGLTYAIIGILRLFKITDPMVDMELMQFFLFHFTLTIVLILDKQKWWNVPQNTLQLKSVNVISLVLLMLATRIIIKSVFLIDNFLHDIPLDTKYPDYRFSLYLNIIIVITYVIAAPVFEEIVFRKWIFGLFISQGKQIYFGLILSSVVFCFIHDISSFSGIFSQE